jgi:predicted DsbA family dithiol-disulfide isomerase
MTDGPLVLTVWSDFLCPWCYVAAVRLAKLESDYDGKIELEWRTYLLQPEPRPKPIDRFIAYTQRWIAPGGPGDSEPRCGFRVWDEHDDPPPTHSLPIAIAAKIARRYGRSEFDRFHLAGMRAYFVDHRTVSDLDVLADIAGSCGLPASEFREQLVAEGGTIGASVLAEHRDAIDNDVHAVPSVVVNGFPIPGAQDLDVYRRMIDRLLAKLDAD